MECLVCPPSAVLPIMLSIKDIFILSSKRCWIDFFLNPTLQWYLIDKYMVLYKKKDNFKRRMCIRMNHVVLYFMSFVKRKLLTR